MGRRCPRGGDAHGDGMPLGITMGKRCPLVVSVGRRIPWWSLWEDAAHGDEVPTGTGCPWGWDALGDTHGE